MTKEQLLNEKQQNAEIIANIKTELANIRLTIAKANQLHVAALKRQKEIEVELNNL